MSFLRLSTTLDARFHSRKTHPKAKRTNSITKPSPDIETKFCQIEKKVIVRKKGASTELIVREKAFEHFRSRAYHHPEQKEANHTILPSEIDLESQRDERVMTTDPKVSCKRHCNSEEQFRTESELWCQRIECLLESQSDEEGENDEIDFSG